MEVDVSILMIDMEETETDTELEEPRIIQNASEPRHQLEPDGPQIVVVTIDEPKNSEPRHQLEPDGPQIVVVTIEEPKNPQSIEKTTEQEEPEFTKERKKRKSSKKKSLLNLNPTVPKSNLLQYVPCFSALGAEKKSNPCPCVQNARCPTTST